jgi:hypothetical protein
VDMVVRGRRRRRVAFGEGEEAARSGGDAVCGGARQRWGSGGGDAISSSSDSEGRTGGTDRVVVGPTWGRRRKMWK